MVLNEDTFLKSCVTTEYFCMPEWPECSVITLGKLNLLESMSCLCSPCVKHLAPPMNELVLIHPTNRLLLHEWPGVTLLRGWKSGSQL